MAATSALNKAALDQFIQLPVSRSMVSHLAERAGEVIRCGPDPTPPMTPPIDGASAPLESQLPSLPPLELFIQSLVDRSRIQIPTLMSSLIYLSRLTSRLPPVAKNIRCTVYRVFLASLILAAKNLNDSTPKNKYWASRTAVSGYNDFGFSITEVNLMEKQVLYLLDWDLRINLEDLYTNLNPFLAPIRAKHLERKERINKNQAMQRENDSISAQINFGYPTPPSRARLAQKSSSSSRVSRFSPPPPHLGHGHVKSIWDSTTHIREPKMVVQQSDTAYHHDTQMGYEQIHEIAGSYVPTVHPLAVEEKSATKARTMQSGGILTRFLSATGASSNRRTVRIGL